jgi:hypothetical protein
MFILAWTAADISNAEICALDQEAFPSPAQKSSQTQLPAGSDQDVHFDDCFCCSHCVEPGFVFRVDISVEPAGQLAPRVIRSPHKIHVSLYHPPRTAS